MKKYKFMARELPCSCSLHLIPVLNNLGQHGWQREIEESEEENNERDKPSF